MVSISVRMASSRASAALDVCEVELAGGGDRAPARFFLFIG
jgi:hypothetical protein|tara:strand:- start:98 stop:220 length:123 start_codon:yes stop_codon:yes gene_type:complete